MIVDEESYHIIPNTRLTGMMLEKAPDLKSEKGVP